MQATTSKRSNEEDGTTSPSIIKKQRTDDGPISVIKHFIVDKANFVLSQIQIQSLFKSIRIMVSDTEIDKNNNSVEHYHILGEAKYTKRVIRDMSLCSLRAGGILGGLEAKNFFLSARIKNIESLRHFNNTVEYLKRKNRTMMEDDSVTYGPLQNPVWRILDEAEEPAKYGKEDMAEFRRRFPIQNSWKRVAAQKKLSKFAILQLEEMESQRKHEDGVRPLTNEEKHLLMPNMPILAHANSFRNQLINHDQNSGVCLILCGGALMAKSTINRILGHSFGEFAIWPGSQWIQRDPLKFDTAARQGISTIVVEEMQWIDIQHRITLEKTLCSIKEQLTGAGLDVRLAKTKSNLQDDIKFKMDFLLISMNETEYVNYRVLSHMINSKPEFKRRFLIINMDDPKFSDIPSCRNRSENNWIGNEQQMEWLSGKALKSSDSINELTELYEEWLWRQGEVRALLDFVENNPNVFDDEVVELTEEEAIQDDVQKVLDDITNKVEAGEMVAQVRRNLGQNFLN